MLYNEELENKMYLKSFSFKEDNEIKLEKVTYIQCTGYK